MNHELVNVPRVEDAMQAQVQRLGIMRVASLAIAIVGLSLMTGCVAMLSSGVVSSWPSYTSTKSELPALGTTEGRIFIYHPPNFMGSPLGGPIIIDEVHKASIGPGTFVFADLPAGKHSLYMKGPMGASRTIEFEIVPQTAIYVRVERGKFSMETPVVVDQEAAEEALATSHHNYKRTEPINRRTKGNRPAI